MKQIILSSFFSLALVGCGGSGGDSGSGGTNPPTNPDQPLIPLEPSTPANPDIPLTPLEPSIPVNPDQPLIPLEPSTPANPDIPLTPLEPAKPLPTAPCGDNGECLDDDRFNQFESLEVRTYISDVLNWNFSDINYMCNHLTCDKGEDGSIAISDGSTFSYPLTNEIFVEVEQKVPNSHAMSDFSMTLDPLYGSGDVVTSQEVAYIDGFLVLKATISVNPDTVIERYMDYKSITYNVSGIINYKGQPFAPEEFSLGYKAMDGKAIHGLELIKIMAVDRRS